MLVKKLNELKLLLKEITDSGIAPTPITPSTEEATESVDRCKYRHEDNFGSLNSEFVGKVNNEWSGIDYSNNYNAYPTGVYYNTDNPGQNQYGIYYEDMPAAVANPSACEPGPEEFGSTQADLNWLLFNNKNRGIVSGVKNTDELYEMLVANHRLTKFKDTPNGIPVIKTNELTIM